jgi:hypothetical protein
MRTAKTVQVLMRAEELDGYTKDDGEYMPVLIVKRHPKRLDAVGFSLDGHDYVFAIKALLSAIRKATYRGVRACRP